MKTYQVTLPIVGYAVVDVQAVDEKDAVDRALDAVGQEHIESWEAVKVVVEGNVFRGPRNRAEAEAIDE